MEDEELPQIDRAGRMAGEYIESLGKTNAPLSSFTLEEWRELLFVIVKGYHDAPAK